VCFPIQLWNCTPCKVILWSIVVPASVCIFLCSEIFFAFNDLIIEGQKRNWNGMHPDFRLTVVGEAYVLYVYVYVYIHIYRTYSCAHMYMLPRMRTVGKTKVLLKILFLSDNILCIIFMRKWRVYKGLFLGEYLKLRRGTINFVTRICLSVRPRGTNRLPLNGFS
jgi:hypothetical protein